MSATASNAAINSRGRARMTRRIFGSRRRGGLEGFAIPSFDPEMPWRSSRVEAMLAVLYPRAMTAFARSRPLRLIGWAVGIIVAILLIPYVLAPVYRFRHPISALMLEARRRGAAVARIRIPLDAVPPAVS